MTREEKAIRIAEFEGWKDTHDDNLGWKRNKNHYGNKDWLIGYYSSFNGLMPIILSYPNFTIYSQNMITVCLCNGEFNEFYLPRNKEDGVDRERDEIDVCQDAILYFFENREVENGD